MSYRSFLSVSCLCILASLSAHATDFQSPRTAGLGGAGHAGPILTDAIYMNPAMMPFLQSYTMSLSHNTYSGPDDSEPKGKLQNASIQDGTNSLFQAGVGYTRKTYGNMVNIGASTRVFNKYGVGVGGKFLFGSATRESAQDVTVAALGSVTEWLQTGIILDNALSSSKSKQWNDGRELIFAMKLNFQKMLLLYIDPHYVPNKAGSHLGVEAGVEIPLMQDLFIRAGLNRDSFQPHLGTYGRGYGFGFGWSFPRISLDGSMSRTEGPIRTNNLLFSITII